MLQSEPAETRKSATSLFWKGLLGGDVFDQAGKRFTPREWFIAPLPIIEEAIRLIVSGEIVMYEYDEESKLVRLK
jgi:hypothetical protein